MTQLVVLAAAGMLVLAAFAAAFLHFLNTTLGRHTNERASWARERAFLLQRIQAPQVAVAQFDPTDDEPEPTDEPSEEAMRVFHNEQDEIAHANGRL